ncbi:hypothetical protein BDF20DRAFT_548717 [Mycotypha africana]|uniref:uncharacterized protein n=1 Tax=Mycotypha africana TaxID=64632 RepID=UPI002300C90E|nr:uncharacterized protein BDF20DRAFT_548717 [Mycotypha africana]KAI8977162.1 hypothetical protein BDF20DRAFT_548717 [Mycotypha africana]
MRQLLLIAHTSLSLSIACTFLWVVCFPLPPPSFTGMGWDLPSSEFQYSDAQRLSHHTQLYPSAIHHKKNCLLFEAHDMTFLCANVCLRS